METRDNILARIRSDVKKFGQSVVGVMDAGKSFYYTVGRAKRGLPELLIVCPLSPESGKALLNHLDELMPKVVASGERVSLGGTHPVLILDAGDPRAKKEYTRIANLFSKGKGKYRVQQVLLCDKNGRFPPDCEAPWNQQPLLGDSPVFH